MPETVLPERDRTTPAGYDGGSGMDVIDFWAVDFDWSAGKPFNPDAVDLRGCFRT